MAEIIKARVWQKVDTEANWNANPLILGPGEQAFVVNSAGLPINFKVGDGTKRFSQLSWSIQYAGGQYIQIVGNVLPAPAVDAGYSLVGPGTYTFSGQANIVAPEGRLSQLLWDGTSWSLVDMGELPIQDISGLATKDELEVEVNSILAFINSNGAIDYKFKPILTEGYLITSGGNYVATTNIWWASEQFIPLNGATSVVYSGRVGEAGTKIAFYSEANAASMIESYPAVVESNTFFETPTPDGAKYIRVTCRDVGLVNFYLIFKGYKFEPEKNTPLFDFRIIGTEIVYENQAIKEADIIWNDNSTGRIVYSDWDENNATYKSFVATSIENGKLVTQPPVTFDSSGQITDYPDFIITTL